MNNDDRTIGVSEQAAIDRLVDAVDAGDTSGKIRCGRLLSEGQSALGWHAARFVDVGKFAPLAAAAEPTDPEDGDPIAFALAPESGSVWAVAELRHSDGRRAYAAFSGRGGMEDDDLRGEVHVPDLDVPERPRTRCEWSFVAAYGTYSEAMSALKSKGYTGERDYRDRAGR